MKHLVLYYSTTGNSLAVAKELERGIKDSELEDLLSLEKTKDLSSYESIGFVFPCHLMGVPTFILDKINILNLPKSTYYYAINTSNGAYGDVGNQFKKFLAKKGCQLSYFKPIQMIGNYILAYDLPNRSDRAGLLAHAIKECTEVFEAIAIRRTIEIKPNNPVMTRSVNLLYKKDKKKWKNQFYTSEDCDGCGFCEKACRFNNIQMKSGKPIWGNNCEQCIACIHLCPKQAIELEGQTEGKERYIHPDISPNELV